MEKTDLELFNEYLRKVADLDRAGLRRKCVAVTKFVNTLMKKNIKNPEKEYLVLYLHAEDTTPAKKWCTADELSKFDKTSGKHTERIIIRGGEVISDTSTEGIRQ